MSARRIAVANDEYQQLSALRTNRTARARHGAVLVEGVQPIATAVDAGWPVRTWLAAEGRRRSDWARRLLESTPAELVEMPAHLLDQLSGRDEPSELLAVVETRARSVADVPPGLVIVLDRPSLPGNVGAIVRTADAFDATGIVVTGHAADPFDPRAIAASRGSVFRVPIATAPSAASMAEWLDGRKVVGADETGDVDLADAALDEPLAIVLGNEARGMGAAWRDRCDLLVRIPMRGGARSLNVAAAAAVLLYEVDRRRIASA